MLFRNVCYTVGFIGGAILIIFGIQARRRLPQKSVSTSLILAGGCSVIWSALGEILCWSNIIPQGGDLLKMLIGGIAAGILINMVLSRQTNGLTLDLFRKRVDSKRPEE